MSMSFEELSRIVEATAFQNAENSKNIAEQSRNISEQGRNIAEQSRNIERLERNIQDFVQENRLKFGKNQQELAEVFLSIRETQTEIKGLATNIGRMVEAMNNRGNL
jgi:HAMP domain-containing protein